MYAARSLLPAPCALMLRFAVGVRWTRLAPLRYASTVRIGQVSAVWDCGRCIDERACDSSECTRRRLVRVMCLCSVRKERRIRPGFTPFEDVPRFRPRRLRERDEAHKDVAQTRTDELAEEKTRAIGTPAQPDRAQLHAKPPKQVSSEHTAKDKERKNVQDNRVLPKKGTNDGPSKPTFDKVRSEPGASPNKPANKAGASVDELEKQLSSLTMHEKGIHTER